MSTNSRYGNETGETYRLLDTHGLLRLCRASHREVDDADNE